MRTLVVASTLAIAVLASAGSARAQAQEEPSSGDVAAARALGQEGVKLADAGNCVEAIDRLARAEKLFHAPTTLGRLGECQVQTGKVVEGTENLNRVVREQLGPGAPAAFSAAQERAKKVLDEAKPKIAKLKIAVAAPPDAQVTVKIDGEHVPLANLNMNRPIDPGEHNVEATAPGFKPATAKVKLSEGGVDSIALTLEPDPNAPKAAPAQVVAPPPAQTQPAPENPQRAESGSSRVPAYAAFGVGVIGLGVGTVTGLMASSKKSDLEGQCDSSGACPESARDTLDSGKTLGTVSTVGFVVGAVGIAAGVVLYLTSGPSSARASATANGLRIRF